MSDEHKICFSFILSRNTGVISTFIRHIISDSGLPHRWLDSAKEIRLIVVGGEDKLAALADKLGRELPLSIYLESSAVTPVAKDPSPDENNNEYQSRDPVPPHEKLAVEHPEPPGPVSPCPRCLSLAEESFKAGRAGELEPCGICLGSKPGRWHLTFLPSPSKAAPPGKSAHETLEIRDEEGERNSASLFYAAELLAQGYTLAITDPEGRTIYAGNTPAALPSPPNMVQINSPTALPRLWRCGEAELMLLAALEKPLIRLEPTPEARQEYNLANRPLPVGLAPDLFFWYLGRYLHQLDIPQLFLREPGETHRPLVMANNGVTGTRHGTPWIISQTTPYGGMVWSNSFTVNHHAPCKGLRWAETPIEPAHHLRAFQLFLAHSANSPQPEEEQNCFGISLYPNPGGVMLMGVDSRKELGIISSLPTGRARSIFTIFKEIEELDREASRLLANFFRHYPERRRALFELKLELNPESLAHLWLLLLFLSGAEDDCRATTGELDNCGQAATEKFLTLAAEAIPGRSPRLETVRPGEKKLLDHRLLLRSALSYTLAGTTPAALCRGFLESLGERISQIIWEHAPLEHAPQVALCSELCLHPAFFNAVSRQGGESFLLAPPPWPINTLATNAPDTIAFEEQPPRCHLPANNPLSPGGTGNMSQSENPDQQRRNALKSAFGMLKQSPEPRARK
mgnify:CR=1 FL=1